MSPVAKELSGVRLFDKDREIIWHKDLLKYSIKETIGAPPGPTAPLKQPPKDPPPEPPKEPPDPPEDPPEWPPEPPAPPDEPPVGRVKGLHKEP
jgi:hypothetical protein